MGNILSTRNTPPTVSELVPKPSATNTTEVSAEQHEEEMQSDGKVSPMITMPSVTNTIEAPAERANDQRQGNEKVSLMALPPEIRNNIFNLAFINRDPQTGKLDPLRLESLHMARLRFLRPLHITKDLLQELRPVVFGANLFVLQQRHHEQDTYQGKLRQNRLKLESGVDTVPHSYHSGIRDHLFNIELPPVGARKLMRKLRIVLAQDHAVDNLLEGDGTSPKALWGPIGRRLEVVQNLKIWGFAKLDVLELHVDKWYRRSSGARDVKEFVEWIEADQSGVDTLGAKIVVECVRNVFLTQTRT